ncbi:MAG: ABC transporter ATP-binding protein [Mycobacteriaceae bacterium]|uniref:ABC transporter ATP-binding protein n=1 Tax=Corynebacterium sp. TaxID=1720 RepID=UPI003F9CF55F
MLTRIRTITGGGPDFTAFLGLTVLSAILQAAAVIVLFPLLDQLFGTSPVDAWPWVLLMVALIAAAWGIDIVSAHRGLEVGLALMHAIQRYTPDAVLTWPSSVLTRKKSSDLRRLLSNGATEVTSAPVLMVGPLITSVVFMFALAVGLLFVNVPVALVTLLGGVLMLGAFQLSNRMTSRADDEFTAANSTLDDRLFDFARAQPSLRTARRVSTGARLVDDAVSASRGRSLRLLLWQVPGELVFSVVLQIVLLGFGVTAWMAYDNGTLTGVSAAVTVIVMLRVVEQVNGVSGLSGGIRSLQVTLDEAAAVRDTRAPELPAPSPTPAPAALRGASVRFPDGTVGLDSVDLDLRPGTVTVVVGRSGSGKTTLLRTLAGLTDTTDGTISLDGTTSDTAALRSNATMVFQETSLGAGSLRDNLTAVNPDLSDADLERLADAAGLRTVLSSIPTGWDTPVGELGNHLSGGERQRVGIARALAKPAHLLLVDEATSALDARNEASIVQSIKAVRGDYTTVIVTHRPATLEIADTVVVLGDGRVVERGTPAELEAAGGEFARLVQEWRDSAAWRVGG